MVCQTERECTRRELDCSVTPLAHVSMSLSYSSRRAPTAADSTASYFVDAAWVQGGCDTTLSFATKQQLSRWLPPSQWHDNSYPESPSGLVARCAPLSVLISLRGNPSPAVGDAAVAPAVQGDAAALPQDDVTHRYLMDVLSPSTAGIVTTGESRRSVAGREVALASWMMPTRMQGGCLQMTYEIAAY